MYAFFVEGDHAGSEEAYWSESWAAAGVQRRSAGRTILLSAEYREIRKRLAPPAKLLEAGCGHGLWVLRLAEKGYRVTGVDFSSSTIEALKKAHRDQTWVVGDVRRTEFADNMFDGVLSWGVVEHFQNGCEDILQDTYRIIKPGGYLFITVPYLSAMRRRMWGTESGSNVAQVDPNKAKFFQYYMTKEDLSAVVRAAPFVIESLEPVQMYFINKWAKNAMLRKVQILVNALLSRFVDGEEGNCMLLCVARKPL